MSDRLKRKGSGAGYSIDAAMTKAEATQFIHKKDYDLVVLDINLPDGNGFDICKELKERCPNTAVIFLTDRDMERDQLRGFEAGADDYVTKPFPISVFLKKVAALLQRITKQNGGDCYDNGNLFISPIILFKTIVLITKIFPVSVKTVSGNYGERAITFLSDW